MKALIMIDSFKGTITSKRLGEITKEELEKKNIDCDYFPIADGGDGFLDSIEVFIKAEKVICKCYDPFFRLIDSYYLYDKENKISYIELAKASGINLVKKEELNPFVASTYGLGELIKNAIQLGSKKIVLGVGGSATDDGGTGMLEALGVKFTNKNGEKIEKISNGKMKEIDNIDVSSLKELIKDIEFLVLNDVTNPLLGEKGATYIFAPQKGAKEIDLPILEDNMRYYSTKTKEALGIDEKDYPGSGAVGGCGFALRSYMKAEFIPGINYLLDLLEKNYDLTKYDVVISGEGRIDNQTLDGKVVSGITSKFDGKKKILVCALNELDSIEDSVIYSVVPQVATVDESMSNPEECYRKLCELIEIEE